MGENRTHPATAELLKDPERNGLSDHWRESYVREAGKSMKIREEGRRWVQSAPFVAGYPLLTVVKGVRVAHAFSPHSRGFAALLTFFARGPRGQASV